MNKIKKNGWGLRVELIFIIIFLICLMIATIGLFEFGLLGDNPNGIYGNSNNTTKSNFSYQALENQLYSASIRYFNNHDYDLDSEVIIIRHSILIDSNYMGELIDENGNKCVGYTKVIRQSDGPYFTSYIKCQNYMTNGYSYE